MSAKVQPLVLSAKELAKLRAWIKPSDGSLPETRRAVERLVQQTREDR